MNCIEKLLVPFEQVTNKVQGDKRVTLKLCTSLLINIIRYAIYHYRLCCANAKEYSNIHP